VAARHPPGRGARALDAAGQDDVRRAAGHQRRPEPHRLEPRAALPVDRHARHLDAEARGQHRDPGDVAARAAAVAEDDVVHLDVVRPHRTVEPVEVVDQRGQHRAGQPGRVDPGEPAAGGRDRRAARGHDDGASRIHRPSL
jgi:hypothetical protein